MFYHVKTCTVVIFFSGPSTDIPGVAIYKERDKLGVIVSTGDQLWDLAVAGAAPTGDTWTNIALRWKPPTVTDSIKYKEALKGQVGNQGFGGIELFVNGKSVGHLIEPKHFSHKIKDNKQQIMLGCHKTVDNHKLRGFAAGSYQEVAEWDWQLADDELSKLLGGYDEDLIALPADELLEVLVHINVTELYQAEMTSKLVTSVINNKYDTVYNNRSNTYLLLTVHITGTNDISLYRWS